MTSSQLRILSIALAIESSLPKLARRLGTPEELLLQCLQQEAELPNHAFLKALDVVAFHHGRLSERLHDIEQSIRRAFLPGGLQTASEDSR